MLHFDLVSSVSADCFALCCISLLCNLLHFTALHFVALYCIVLHFTALHCTRTILRSGGVGCTSVHQILLRASLHWRSRRAIKLCTNLQPKNHILKCELIKNHSLGSLGRNLLPKRMFLHNIVERAEIVPQYTDCLLKDYTISRKRITKKVSCVRKVDHSEDNFFLSSPQPFPKKLYAITDQTFVF